MKLEIIDSPLQFRLVGFRGEIAGASIAQVGKRLMDKMWREIHTLGIKTKGINFWVYLPNSTIFTGVELAEENAAVPETLEELQVSLTRYLRHVHVGLYSTLPEIWPQLFALVKQQAEITSGPSLEIYGHWHENPEKCETTILIALQ